MDTYKQFFPAASDFLALPVEQGALCTLRMLEHTRSPFSLGQVANPHDDYGVKAWSGRERLVETCRGLAETWTWLIGGGYLAQDPMGMNEGWYFVSRRGRAWLASADPSRWLASTQLRSDLLDPELAAEVLPRFITGNLDSAVRDAFRRVEVRLRVRTGIGEGPPASVLVQMAFRSPKPDGTGAGPLVAGRGREASQIEGERDLFSGAMKRFRNPGTHNDIGLDDPAEAVELILLANMLLRLLDRIHTECAAAGGTKGVP